MFKSSTQPLCRYCAAPIRKHAITVYVRRSQGEHDRPYEGFSRYAYTAEPLKSKAECQRVTNNKVLSVSWSRGSTANYEPDPAKDEITSFTEWDGESYSDQFFCKGEHAKDFGYSLARSTTFAMKEYHEAMAKRAAQ